MSNLKKVVFYFSGQDVPGADTKDYKAEFNPYEYEFLIKSIRLDMIELFGGTSTQTLHAIKNMKPDWIDTAPEESIISKCYELCESCQSRRDGWSNPVQDYLDKVEVQE